MHQLLATEGGLPESATKTDGLFSSIVIVRDGALLSDTGESRLAYETPNQLQVLEGASQAMVPRMQSQQLQQQPEILGMSVGLERPSALREQLEMEGQPTTIASHRCLRILSSDACLHAVLL